MSSLRDVISSRILACMGCILQATARKKSSLSRTDIFREGNITILAPRALVGPAGSQGFAAARFPLGLLSFL